MAERGQAPRVRMDAQSEFTGDRPAFNIVGMIRGTELPDEYVMLSAHLDSWDGASGATDNGTGTIMMMEAMRILRATYPNPRRSIIVGHWGGEEQGLLGSTAFREDHPEVVDGMAGWVQPRQRYLESRLHSNAGLPWSRCALRAVVLIDAERDHRPSRARCAECPRGGSRCPAEPGGALVVAVITWLSRASPFPCSASSRTILTIDQVHMAHEHRHFRQADLRRFAS